MSCSNPQHKHPGQADPQHLALEAASVGVLLLPTWWLVAKATTAMRLGFTSNEAKAALDVALAGALFHVVAEEFGVNAWFLTNSYAAKKAFATVDGSANVSDDMVDLRFNYGFPLQP